MVALVQVNFFYSNGYFQNVSPIIIRVDVPCFPFVIKIVFRKANLLLLSLLEKEKSRGEWSRPKQRLRAFSLDHI